jgi:hypothetical protein
MERGKMNSKESPYRAIFHELESKSYTTIDAYRSFYTWTETNDIDPCVYLSSAITSGGLARDPNVSFAEMMEVHTDFGDRMAHVIASQESDSYITRQDIIAPADLGKVPEWGQADYLLFWMHVITGLDPREASEIDADIRQNRMTEKPGFFDKSLPREQRLDDYLALAEGYAEAVGKLDCGKGKYGRNLPRNIQTLVPILDPEESLGVQSELHLCRLLGFGEYSLNLQKEHLHDTTMQIIERLRTVGARALKQGGDLDISGRQNFDAYRRQAHRGVRWRKPGFYAIWERRDYAIAKNQEPREIPEESQAEMWAKYFEGTLQQPNNPDIAV